MLQTHINLGVAILGLVYYNLVINVFHITNNATYAILLHSNGPYIQKNNQSHITASAMHSLGLSTSLPQCGQMIGTSLS